MLPLLQLLTTAVTFHPGWGSLSGSIKETDHINFKLLISDCAVEVKWADWAKSAIFLFMPCSAEALEQLLLKRTTWMVWKPTQLGKAVRADDDDDDDDYCYLCLCWDILIELGALWRSTRTKHGLHYYFSGEAIKWNVDNNPLAGCATYNKGVPFSLLMY